MMIIGEFVTWLKNIRDARDTYYNSKLEESNGDGKGIWKTLNTVLNRN